MSVKTTIWKAGRLIAAAVGASVILIALVIGWIVVSNRHPSTPGASVADLPAAVRFNGTQFVIQNTGADTWTDVKCQVNGGVFGGGFEYRFSALGGHEIATVGALQFAKSDGTRFNPSQHKAQSFVVLAKVNGSTRTYAGAWQ